MIEESHFMNSDEDLAALGWNDWCRERRREQGMADWPVARVTRVDRERYLVCSGRDEVQAEATGRLLFGSASPEDLPCVGDWVFVRYHNDDTLAMIHDVLPRRTFLRRKSAGARAEYQMIAANIDTGIIMQSCNSDFNLRRLERSLIMLGDGGVKPAVLLSKTDLVGAGELAEKVAAISRACAGAEVITCSSVTAEGLDNVRGLMTPGKTFCLIGSSGVGKSTLVNNLLGRDELATSAIRESDGRGRHTTSSRQLKVLDSGALLIDTPGIRELGMLGVGESIDESFAEISGLTGECRFRDCTHLKEAGCAVLRALEEGTLSRERYDSYLKLRKESAFHEMSYLERRKKDKEFGRMIKSVKQHMRKKSP